MKNILVTRSSMPELEEYIDEIKDMWESHWLTNMGAKHQRFEDELKKYLGVPGITLFTNGHLALESALEALNLPEESEIITTPFTFASTTHAIVRKGMRPVFCDINERDLTMDADRIEDLISPRTSAILPVHVYGYLCDVERIEDIARRHGLKVIYDAAHAFGVRYNGRSAGDFGDISMFSFHATKVFNTIEGGALCYRDESLGGVLSDLKDFGFHGQESVERVGGNAKMSEFQAAMGLCNLRHIDEEIAKRERADTYYRKRLSGIDGIRLFSSSKNTVHNYAYFPVLFDGYRYSRDEIAERLASEGIYARKYFYPLTNDFLCYRDYPTAGGEKTPVARYISERILTLPLYADLDPGDIDAIADIILG